MSLDEGIAHAAGLEPTIARDIVKRVDLPSDWDQSDLYGWRRRWGTQHERAWWAFVKELKSEARYFGSAADILHGLFDAIDAFRGGWAVRTIGNEVVIYRVRIATGLQRTIAKAPAKELGPPPPKECLAGRMNTAGIPVFYGAFERAVAIAETRPSVGDVVAVGRFRPRRPLRVLNTSAVVDLPATEVFSTTWDRDESLTAFLRTFDMEVSAPVLPGDQSIDYLPTQVVAEFLWKIGGFDGICYSSAQVGKSANSRGVNVALFGPAGRVSESPEDQSAGLEWAGEPIELREIDGVSVSDTEHYYLDPANYPDPTPDAD